MADRGEYRAVRRVLLDGPDFQRLSERARWVFVALKLNIGPTGIEVHYPGALEHQLAAQTGASVEGVSAAMAELEAADWIRREGNVLWIVGQLEHDPHVSASDPKHRKSIQRHLSGLPRLYLVRRFIEEHAPWMEGHEGDPFKGLPQGPPKALARPSEAPNTEDREPKTDKDSVANATGEAPTGWDDVRNTIAGMIRSDCWLGGEPERGWHMGKELDVAKGLIGEFTAEELVGGMECYREAHDLAPDQRWSLSWVQSHDDRWRMKHAVAVWRQKQIDQVEDPRITDLTLRLGRISA